MDLQELGLANMQYIHEEDSTRAIAEKTREWRRRAKDILS